MPGCVQGGRGGTVRAGEAAQVRGSCRCMAEQYSRQRVRLGYSREDGKVLALGLPSAASHCTTVTFGV